MSETETKWEGLHGQVTSAIGDENFVIDSVTHRGVAERQGKIYINSKF